ncbi:MAG: hypothetical protein J5871_05085 [Bacteroidales bacterium]|nr:hypothetical protein [Bacteroidales bacterium]
MIKKIAIEGVRPESIPALLRDNRVPYETVSTVNWPAEFPYAPDARFAVAHTGKEFLLHYIVREARSRAAADTDGGRVWEDSCMEFFLAPDPAGYYNIECNCIGRMVLGYGTGRHGREAAGEDVFRAIRRWTSLPPQPFAEKAVDEWQVALAIPVACLFRHAFDKVDGMQAKGNFYKCGDLLSTVHFTTWAPIRTEHPDFHRPEYFVPLSFE